MSGLENIIARLEQENAEACAVVAAEAEARAAGIVADAKAEGKETVRRMTAEAEALAAQTEARARSAGALQSRQALLGAKLKLIDGVLAEAGRQLHTLPTETYFKTMAALAVKNRRPGDGVLFLNAADLARMPAGFPAQLGDGVKVSPTPLDIPDGFVLKYGDIEFNCTLKALFDSARDTLRAEAGAILFG